MIATGDGPGLVQLDVHGAATLVTLGIVCTGVSFVLYFRIVQVIGSVGASTVTYIIRAFALLFGVVFLDEEIEPRTVAGMAMIALGVAGVMSGPRLEDMLAEVRCAWYARRQRVVANG
jgi:drug/metabolite transporter (DMT)-like permease